MPIYWDGSAWAVAPVNWPGANTFRANGLKGVYAGLGRCVGQGSGGYTIYRPQYWVFRNTQLGHGDQLGAVFRIFGYEADGIDYRMEDGLPFATGSDGADSAVQILALGLAINVEPSTGVWGETVYFGEGDAQFKAQALYSELTPETMDQSARGNGEIVHWVRGKCVVFN